MESLYCREMEQSLIISINYTFEYVPVNMTAALIISQWTLNVNAW